jgi:uncharacterized membrane protein
MSDDLLTVATIVAMAAATYLTRIGGLYLMRGVRVKGGSRQLSTRCRRPC